MILEYLWIFSSLLTVISCSVERGINSRTSGSCITKNNILYTEDQYNQDTIIAYTIDMLSSEYQETEIQRVDEKPSSSQFPSLPKCPNNPNNHKFESSNASKNRKPILMSQNLETTKRLVLPFFDPHNNEWSSSLILEATLQYGTSIEAIDGVSSETHSSVDYNQLQSYENSESKNDSSSDDKYITDSFVQTCLDSEHTVSPGVDVISKIEFRIIPDPIDYYTGSEEKRKEEEFIYMKFFDRFYILDHASSLEGYSRLLKDYAFIKSIGSGSYGNALLCKDPHDNLRFIVIKLFDLSMPSYRVRTLESFYQELFFTGFYFTIFQHPNICKALGTIDNQYIDVETQNVGIIYEFLGLSLHYMVADWNQLPPFTIQNPKRCVSRKRILIKGWMRGLLRALEHLHIHNIIHRDIKLLNMMISKMNKIGYDEATESFKIIDFGMSNIYSKDLVGFIQKSKIVTSWHRAPEISLGLPYDFSIDIFAAGICMYRLYAGRDMMNGINNDDIIPCIFLDHLGPHRFYFPTNNDWPGVESGVDYEHYKMLCTELYSAKRKLLQKDDPRFSDGIDPSLFPVHYEQDKMLEVMGPEAYQVYSSMVALDPSKRLTAKQLLELDWFKNSFDNN